MTLFSPANIVLIAGSWLLFCAWFDHHYIISAISLAAELARLAGLVLHGLMTLRWISVATLGQYYLQIVALAFLGANSCTSSVIEYAGKYLTIGPIGSGCCA